MSDIRVRKTKEDEVIWLNSCYEKIGFKKSEFSNEFIVVTEFNNQKFGLGRFFKLDEENCELGGIFVDDQYRGMGIVIVSFLCDEIDWTHKNIWCLPFENLEGLHNEFGFNIPKALLLKEIFDKNVWCNKNAGYTKKVLLLSKHMS